MNEQSLQRLEYDKIKANVAGYALSYLGKNQVEALQPHTDLQRIENELGEVEEGLKVIEFGASVPIPSLDGMEKIFAKLGRGYIFTEQELADIGKFVYSVKQLKRFMEKKESIAPRICSYAYSLHDLSVLEQNIERCIWHGKIADAASAELTRIRKKIAAHEDKIKKKLDSTMRKYKSYIQEQVISMRNDRYVIPVKKEYRKMVHGAVLDESASGQTVFIEPSDISTLHYDLSALRAEESREETRILSELAELIERHAHEISINLETVGTYDFLFAKAKYAKAIGGRSVRLNDKGRIRLNGARHPLLSGRHVPLEFGIGGTYSALIITGPNTGGKTVSLKTVGLLTLMAQSGLLIPVERESELAVYNDILVDIGDGQSIEQSLSTFSSHITNVIKILKQAGPRTLILLDEMATGTDPGEGIGLSIAILEQLFKQGATIVATTHFNEIKKFAEVTPGFQNARMEFDVETLQPLYRLKIGEAGNSYAFFIALKLGISQEIINRSMEITANSQKILETVSLNAATAKEPVEEQNQLLDTPQHELQHEKESCEQPEVGHTLVNDKVERDERPKPYSYTIGACVWIRSLKRTAIVCELPDARGDLIVMIQKQRVKINRKRIEPYIDRNELYPEGDYDMDIVFESKEVRKQRKQMQRKYVKDTVIVHEQKDISPLK